MGAGGGARGSAEGQRGGHAPLTEVLEQRCWAETHGFHDTMSPDSLSVSLVAAFLAKALSDQLISNLHFRLKMHSMGLPS